MFITECRIITKAKGLKLHKQKIQESQDRYISQFEIKLWHWIEHHSVVVVCCLALIVGCAMRLSGWYFKSDDYTRFLLPWYKTIKDGGGINSLSAQVGDYNMPYQTLIALFTYMPFSAKTTYKLLSCIFDLVLSTSVFLFVNRLTADTSKARGTAASVVAFLSPIVVFNSAWWAQCDSIWVSFCILSLLFLTDGNYIKCFITYGVALAFKLQAVFLLPLLIIVYVRQKSFSSVLFLISPIAMFIMSLPAIIMGRSTLDVIYIYINQTETYNSMTINYPNLWALMGLNGGYDYLRSFAILLTFAIVILIYFIMIEFKVELRGPSILDASILLVYCVIFVLPAMHERYAYLVEILLIAASAIDNRFIIPMIIEGLATLGTYSMYLFGANINFLALSILNTLALVVVIIITCRRLLDTTYRTTELDAISQETLV